MRSYQDPAAARVRHLTRVARAARLRGDLAAEAVASGQAAAAYARMIDRDRAAELRASAHQLEERAS